MAYVALFIVGCIFVPLAVCLFFPPRCNHSRSLHYRQREFANRSDPHPANVLNLAAHNGEIAR